MDRLAKAKALFDEGLALFKGDDKQTGLELIQEAADLGLEEARDWIDDYTYDDDCYVQAEA